MAELTHITDHFRAGYLELIGPFLGKPRIASFIWALVTGLQEVENAIQSVITLRMVDTATLTQLKVLGKIVGQRYASEDTEVYRSLIKARIAANRSSGTMNDILRVVQALDYAHIPEWWLPANNIIALRIDGDDALPITAAHSVLRDAKAGHETLYTYHLAGSGTLAKWDSATNPNGLSGGWGRAGAPLVGGRAYRVWT